MTVQAGKKRGMRLKHLVLAAVPLLTAVALALVGAAAGSAARSARSDVAHSTLARNGLIAYESDVAGPLEVFVMNPDGGKKRRLTHSGQNGEPRWSPDGRQIVYNHGGCSTTGCNPATRSALWLMNADGSGQHRLTSGRSVDADPRWSPDGRSIAFTRGTSCTNDGCKLNLWLIRPDGTGARPLTHDGRSSSPTWSPDGTKVAFARADASGNRSDIYVMNADGTGLSNVTARLPARAAECDHPAWSPDGQTIVLSDGFPPEILVFISPNGATPSSRTFRASSGDYVSEPAWSPDSTMVVYQRQQIIQTLGVSKMLKGDTSEHVKPRTVAFDGDNHNPDWQPLK